MSYILGALKKAESDRARDRGVQLDTWNQDEWDEPKPRIQNKGLMISVVIVIFLLVLVVAMLAFQLVFTNIKSTTTAETQRIQSISADQNDLASAAEIDSTERVDSNSVEAVYIAAQDSVKRQGSSFGSPVDSLMDDKQVDAAPPTFSGHMYFPSNRTLSRVFSDSGSHREGELIGRYKVERIEESRVFLSLNGSGSSSSAELIEVSLTQ